MPPAVPAGRRRPAAERDSGSRNERGDEVRERQRGREPRGGGVAPVAQKSANRRPEDEAEPERGANHAHAAGAILGRRDVGNERLRRRNVRAGDARQAARHEQHRE